MADLVTSEPHIGGRMNVTDPCWDAVDLRPALDQWGRLLTAGQALSLPHPLTEWRRSARHRLWQEAQQYRERLTAAAEHAGLAVPKTGDWKNNTDDCPWIMTGHQPVLFHGGLWFKYLATEQAAARYNAAGVAVVIDTDEGDAGTFPYPAAVRPDEDFSVPTMKPDRASLAAGASLYAASEWAEPAQLQETLDRVAGHLQLTGSPGTQSSFRQLAAAVQQLAGSGLTVSEASLVLRWSRGIGAHLLELPLSHICRFPEVQALTAGLLQQADKFAQTYNRQLDDYRSAHGIRNPANPFPSLSASSGTVEMPFWVVDLQAQTRQRLTVQTRGDVCELSAAGQKIAAVPPLQLTEELRVLADRGICLIPRGALITAFLRLLFADLFVHGTGGGHYDEFTTRLIQAWWQIEAPPFAVASASRYLYARERAELKDVQQLDGQLRDLRFNPQRHFGTGVFPESVEHTLQQLYEQKQQVVAQLKSAHAEGRSAKDIGHEIQLVSDRMKAVVDEAFADQLHRLHVMSADTQAAIESREYPWFLFV